MLVANNQLSDGSANLSKDGSGNFGEVLLQSMIQGVFFEFACLSLLAYGAILLYPSTGQAQPSPSEAMLNWLPLGTVEIRCVSGPVSLFDRTTLADPHKASLKDFLQSFAGGNLGCFLSAYEGRDAGILAGKMVSASVRGSQCMEYPDTFVEAPGAANRRVSSGSSGDVKRVCFLDVDIIEFVEPVKNELTADFIAREVNQSMIGTTQVWESTSRFGPTFLKIYLSFADDHTVIVSSARSPALLLESLERKNTKANSCVVQSNHVGWSYVDRQSDYWYFNANPAANRLLSTFSEAGSLDGYAKSALAVVAQFRPVATPTFQFAFVSTSSNAMALLTERLDLNFVTPRVRFTLEEDNVIQFDYQPTASGGNDYGVVIAALYSMVAHEVH